MIKILIASLLLSLCLAKKEFVHTLTEDNFKSFLKEHPKALVEFYAPWCGHCKALAPEYEEAAKQLSEDDAIETVLAKVDATVHEKLAEKYGVQGFPTLKYFSGDSESPTEYTGGRTSDTIVSWIQARALPAVSMLKDEAAFKKFSEQKKTVAILFTEADSAEAATFADYADSNREAVLCGSVTDADLTSKLGGKKNTIQLFPSHLEENEKALVFEGPMEADDIKKFVDSERFPLFDAIGPDNYKEYVDRGFPLVWVSLDGSDEEAMEKITKLITPIAKGFKNELSFIWVDNVKYEQHVTNLGIKGTPGMLIAGEGSEKYLFDGEFFGEGVLEKFFKDYKEGTLTAHVKSQPVPEKQDESVYVLVGSEFKNVVGKDKDVLVEFYAPWCGHCKKLEPEYKKVGDAFKDVKDLVVAKIDATENDTPENIQGFPTLIFYPKESSKGENYEGDRTAKAIIDYLKEHATVDTSGMKEEL